MIDLEAPRAMTSCSIILRDLPWSQRNDLDLVVGPEKGVYHIDQNAPLRVAADHPDVGIQREIRKNRKRTYTTSVGVDGAVLSSASG